LGEVEDYQGASTAKASLRACEAESVESGCASLESLPLLPPHIEEQIIRLFGVSKDGHSIMAHVYGLCAIYVPAPVEASKKKEDLGGGIRLLWKTLKGGGFRRKSLGRHLRMIWL
jgi:hypothetical protein